MSEFKNKDYTKEEWLAEAGRRFGKNLEDYKFVCPKCHRINTGKEFKAAGAEPNSMYCECIGRYDKSKGCDWAAYGLFDICTVHVDGHPVFEFADEYFGICVDCKKRRTCPKARKDGTNVMMGCDDREQDDFSRSEVES